MRQRNWLWSRCRPDLDVGGLELLVSDDGRTHAHWPNPDADDGCAHSISHNDATHPNWSDLCTHNGQDEPPYELSYAPAQSTYSRHNGFTDGIQSDDEWR